MFEHEYTAQLILRRMNTDHYSIEYILLSLQSDSNTCSAVKIRCFEHEYTAQLILRRMRGDHYSIEYILLSLQSDSNTCSAVKSDGLIMNTQHSWFWDAWTQIITASSTSFCLYRATSNTCSAVKSDVWSGIHSTTDSETHEQRSLQHRVHPSVFTERLKHMFCCKIRCLNMNTQHSWFWDAWTQIITASSTSFCLYRATQTHVLL